METSANFSHDLRTLRTRRDCIAVRSSGAGKSGASDASTSWAWLGASSQNRNPHAHATLKTTTTMPSAQNEGTSTLAQSLPGSSRHQSTICRASSAAWFRGVS
eukprot:Amastigsp_a850203_7.p3 type:complete len:103 gc:universal Amastigsp_a850203_7:494-802(+)